MNKDRQAETFPLQSSLERMVEQLMGMTREKLSTDLIIKATMKSSKKE